MTVGFDTLDFEGGAEHHAHGAPSPTVPALSVVPDDRSDQLANLVERHRPWAEQMARGLLDRVGGAFELAAVRNVLKTRTDIQNVMGSHGMTAHGALERLILDSARTLSSQVAEA